MRTRSAITIATIVIACAFLGPGCELETNPLELFIGTWVNTDYNGAGRGILHGKQIFTRYDAENNLYVDLYGNDFDTVPGVSALIIKVTDTWSDAGRMCFKGTFTYIFGFLYGLCKFSADENFMEFIVDEFDYPLDLDPSSQAYACYYRQ